MKWQKSPGPLVQSFDHCLPRAEGVERKSMFGYPCAFIHGHLFCGLHQNGIIVRLPQARRDALVVKGAELFVPVPVPGHAATEFVVVPSSIAGDRKKLRVLLGQALAHALSLGAKPKPAKKKTAPVKKKTAPAKKKAPPVKKKIAPAKKKTARNASASKKRAR